MIISRSLGTSNPEQECEESCPIDQIKCLGQVNEGEVQWVSLELLEVVEDNPCECLAHGAEEGNSVIVVAIAAVALIFVERDDLDVPHVLG